MSTSGVGVVLSYFEVWSVKDVYLCRRFLFEETLRQNMAERDADFGAERGQAGSCCPEDDDHEEVMFFDVRLINSPCSSDTSVYLLSFD